MSLWRATDERVLTLPSGRLVRGRGLRAHPDLSPDPDFGVYLLEAPPATPPPWEHIRVDWTDFGLPVDPVAARAALLGAWRRATTERIEIACMGGLGRTGTALACLAVLDGLPPDAAIDLVRSRYEANAIETPEQVSYVGDFATAMADALEDAGDPQPRASRVGAYAVCVEDGHILLSHQISAGPAQGKWTLPGGGINFGEDPAAAAARECWEETRLSPTIGPSLGVHSSLVDAFGTQWHSIRILFAGRFSDDERPTPVSPDDGEIDQVGWFACDALPSPITEWAALGVQLFAAAHASDD